MKRRIEKLRMLLPVCQTRGLCGGPHHTVVPDYCMVGVEGTDIACKIRVTMTSESTDKMKLTGEASRVPYRSLLS